MEGLRIGLGERQMSLADDSDRDLVVVLGHAVHCGTATATMRGSS